MRAFSGIRFFGPAAVMAAVLASTSLAQTTSAPGVLETISPRQHAPMQLLSKGDNGTVSSTNWSGYAVTGTSFTQALGSWIVPAVDCSVTPSTYSAFWVGIDGYPPSTTVEQTGTSSDCNSGTASYYAWYEFYPNPSVTIGLLPVSAGDTISAGVSYSGGEFTISITDVTKGMSFSATAAVAGAAMSSAEWIAEAPSDRRGVLPLADFGTVSFGPDPAGAPGTGISTTNYATEGSGSSIPISAFGSAVEQINMVTDKRIARRDTVEATTSALSTDGTSFTVTWVSE
jgi:hypothetical protein